MKKLLKKIDETVDVAGKEGLGWPKSLSTSENTELVEELVLSQEDQPGSHSTPAEIECELNIDCRSVSRIIDKDLDLCPMRKPNTEERTISSRKLLSKYI